MNLHKNEQTKKQKGTKQQQQKDTEKRKKPQA